MRSQEIKRRGFKKVDRAKALEMREGDKSKQMTKNNPQICSKKRINIKVSHTIYIF